MNQNAQDRPVHELLTEVLGREVKPEECKTLRILSAGGDTLLCAWTEQDGVLVGETFWNAEGHKRMDNKTLASLVNTKVKERGGALFDISKDPVTGQAKDIRISAFETSADQLIVPAVQGGRH